MKAVLQDVVPALRALAVALASVVMAVWWMRGDWPLAVALPLGLMVIGLVVERAGQLLLPSRPVAAVLVMEWWVLVPMAVAAVAATAVIVLTVELTLPDKPKPTPALKETTGALATALTTFLTASFVNASGDRDKSLVGERIQQRLRRRYTRDPAAADARTWYVPKGDPIEQLLYSDNFLGLSGWDRENRNARAREIDGRIESIRPSTGS